ncbi:uncharacterized protein LOC101670818 isoform X1 [Mustela putorius furo]|uniref:Uncharacterized protein LOC101670818 isoform X1 n=1 Tax=Mustela putorius furo TaxID=9669 RepID=A0A8U0V0M3_MUSPF|nr:uncharacterized protein LOC101670818 isoform X1 [Mustela putorius furo]
MVCALGGREGVWVNMSWFKEHGTGQLEREVSNVLGDLAKEQCSKKLVFNCVVYSKTPKFLNSTVRGNETLGLEEVQQRLHDGVIRDIERQNRKKENIRLLGEQIILTEQLEAEREKMLLAKGSQKT